MTDKTDNTQEQKSAELGKTPVTSGKSTSASAPTMAPASSTTNNKADAKPETVLSASTQAQGAAADTKAASPKSSSANMNGPSTSGPNSPPPPPPAPNKPAKSSGSGKVLAIIAIVLAVILAAIVYWHGHQASLAQAEQLQQLQQQLQAQQQQVTDALKAAEMKQTKQLAGVASQQESLNEQIAGVSRKVLDLDTKRPNDWMLAEAEYLVRMAGRKLWLEQDGKSAAMMLAEADSRLAAVNDTSLTPIREALSADITAIKAVPSVDRDGIVIKLNSISNQVEQLKLNKVIMDEAEEPNFTVSNSVNDWKANLQKSWNSFSENFVTVRRRDGKVEALLSPQQHWYLAENLKGTLLQAQLAVYRDQQDIYDSSLAHASDWLTSYFANDSVRQAMLEQIEQLNGQTIRVEYPQQFSAQDKLQQLLDDRLQRLLTGK
ncbi:uroporphyrinogen-III C-methyltransferase [Oceanisphaera sp. W20_SRM_FM3]|uniref:uroporphyrinogen-III C-methyltransferase n=1 Tax=Oceanisphaera sp. W20_SRM_FM3 TaxID=3240267 RepID=UPI003F962E4B